MALIHVVYGIGHVEYIWECCNMGFAPLYVLHMVPYGRTDEAIWEYYHMDFIWNSL